MMIQPISAYGNSALFSLAGTHAATTSQLHRSLGKLASGLAILTAADSPSGLAQSERLRALIGRYGAAVSNVENAISYTNTADSYLQTAGDMVGRMQELAIAANDGTLSDVDRQALQAEFQQLQEGVQDISSGASAMGQFNGNPLFQGETVTIGVGPDAGQTMTLSPIDLTVDSTTVIGQDSGGNPVVWSDIISTDGTGLDISTQQSAQQAVEALPMATDYISQTRATLGAQQSRLTHNLEGMRGAQVNAVSTESRIRDTDMVKELINFYKLLNLGNLNRRILGTATGQILGTG